MGGKGGGHGPSPKAEFVGGGKGKKKGLVKGFLNNGGACAAKGKVAEILSSFEGDLAKKKGKGKSKNSSCSDTIFSSEEDSDGNFSILSDDEREFEAMAARGLSLEQMQEEIVMKFSTRSSHRSRSPKKDVQQPSMPIIHGSAKADLKHRMADSPSNFMDINSNFNTQQAKSNILEVSNSQGVSISSKSQETCAATVQNLQATVPFLDFSHAAMSNSDGNLMDSLANSNADVMQMECVNNSLSKNDLLAAIVPKSDNTKEGCSASLISNANACSAGNRQVNSMLCAAMEFDTLISSNQGMNSAFNSTQHATPIALNDMNPSRFAEISATIESSQHKFQQQLVSNSDRISPISMDEMDTNSSPHTGPQQNVGMATIPLPNSSQTQHNFSSTQSVRQNAKPTSWADLMEFEHGKLNANAPAFVPHSNTSSREHLEANLQPKYPTFSNGQQLELGKQMQPPNAWVKKTHVKVNPLDRDLERSEGQPIKLNLEAVHANLARLERGLVGKLLGKRLPFEVLKAELQRRWDQFGEFSLTTISADCFICIFKHVEAREEVLLGGPWHIMGHIMAIARWTPSFDPASMAGLSAPVWVRFPSLPLLYWDNGCITRIAEAVGEPIYIDGHTAQVERSAFARVCVQVDLSRKVPPGAWVSGLNGNFWQPFEYEGISHLCFHCGRIGHRIATCPLRPAPQPSFPVASGSRRPTPGPHVAQPSSSAAARHPVQTTLTASPSPATLPVAPPPSDPPAASEETQTEHGYGPWTLVQRRRPRVPMHPVWRPKARAATRQPVQEASPSPPLPSARQDVPPQTATEDTTAQPATPMEQQIESPSQQPLSSGSTLRDKLRRLRSRSGAERVSRAYLDKISRELGPLLPSHSRRRRPPAPPESRATPRHRSPDAS